MEWFEIGKNPPPENEYVLVKFDDCFIGISRHSDFEWETGLAWKLPIFSKNKRMRTSADPQYWSYLPE